MKKLLSIALAAATVLCTLAGCSNNAPATSGSAGQNSSGSDATYTIRLGHSNPGDENNIVHYMALTFQEKVAEYSNGAIKVEIYPSNQLGDDQDQIRALQNGSQEMTYTSVQNFAVFCPPLYYFSLPYMFEDQQAAEDAVDAMWEQNDTWLKEKANLHSVGYAFAGFRNLTTDAKHPVTDLASAKGVKVRIPSNAISEAAFTALGFEPAPLAYSEVFTAMQQGTVNGQENCLTTAVSESYAEVQKYVTDIQWQYTIGMLTISNSFYNQLPDELKEAVDKAGKDATEAEIAKFLEMNEKDIQALKDGGMEFLGLPTDYDQWIEIGKSVWSSQYSIIGEGDAAAGEEIVNTVLEMIS
ncbi:MAG: TRAP transporter substrate-binding protein DctP [Lawsonibacter sp.]